MDMDTRNGYLCWKPTRARFSWADRIDILSRTERHGFDYIAFKLGHPLRLVQVTTREVHKPKLKSMIEWCKDAHFQAPEGSVWFEVVLDVWTKPKHRWLCERRFEKEMSELDAKREAWHHRQAQKWT